MPYAMLAVSCLKLVHHMHWVICTLTRRTTALLSHTEVEMYGCVYVCVDSHGDYGWQHVHGVDGCLVGWLYVWMLIFRSWVEVEC